MISATALKGIIRITNATVNVQRSIVTTNILAIKSPGPDEFMPTNVKRDIPGYPDRFRWTLRPRWVVPTLMELNKRRQRVKASNINRQGHEILPKRSEFLEWNYNSELFAFQARISETFDDHKLRQAFISEDYLSAESERRQQLGVDLIESGNGSAVSNKSLAQSGAAIVSATIASYIRLSLPTLPADGVKALVNHLMSENLLAHISFHIGTKDLLLTEEYPPSVRNMSQAFLAVVGALHESAGPERSLRFVLDMFAPQIHGTDITDVWDLKDPMGYLVQVLKAAGRAEPESRLLWVSGQETILSCYHIGIYSNKELIGQAPGETSEIAEELAARDALRRIFRFDDAACPLPMGKSADSIVAAVLQDQKKIGQALHA